MSVRCPSLRLREERDVAGLGVARDVVAAVAAHRAPVPVGAQAHGREAAQVREAQHHRPVGRRSEKTLEDVYLSAASAFESLFSVRQDTIL